MKREPMSGAIDAWYAGTVLLLVLLTLLGYAGIAVAA
jgi:hypothetical protein